MSFAFNQENLQKIEKLIGRYPDPKGLTLPLLWMVQEQEGCLSMESLEAVALITTYSPMEIYKCATFYTMFTFEPKGELHIQVCQSLSCKLSGCDPIYRAIKKRFEIEAGETTEDGRVSLSNVECLGSCGTAPVMQINTLYYEDLTVEKVEAILEKLL